MKPTKTPKKKKRTNPFTNYQSLDQYGKWLGYRIAQFDRKKSQAKMTLTLRQDHVSSAGRIHGGVISGFFDASCGLAVFTTMGPEDFCSTVELKINYFKPLEVGNLLTCQAKVVFRGNRLCTVQALIHKRGLKDPVAMATGTFYVVVKK